MIQNRIRHILFFDGTWNDFDDETNIHHLYQSTLEGLHQGVRQRPVYWKGVGLGPWEKFRGGVFGRYLWRNIVQSYKELALNHLCVPKTLFELMTWWNRLSLSLIHI